MTRMSAEEMEEFLESHFPGMVGGSMRGEKTDHMFAQVRLL